MKNAIADMDKQSDHDILVLDDDQSVRVALARMIRSAGMSATVFAGVDELLASPKLLQCACIVADIRMRGTSGLQMLSLLAEREIDAPVIFVSALDTEEARVAAKKAGAAGFFRKPVDGEALLDALVWAIRNGVSDS